jgi:UDP-N-acetyl-2-amino-2-deoxyglucuronate dehydrogenase
VSEPIGVGLVGMGSIGLRHVEVLGDLDGAVQLVAASGGAAVSLVEAGQPDTRHVTADEVIADPDVELGVHTTTSSTSFPSLRSRLSP